MKMTETEAMTTIRTETMMKMGTIGLTGVGRCRCFVKILVFSKLLRIQPFFISNSFCHLKKTFEVNKKELFGSHNFKIHFTFACELTKPMVHLAYSFKL